MQNPAEECRRSFPPTLRQQVEIVEELHEKSKIWLMKDVLTMAKMSGKMTGQEAAGAHRNTQKQEGRGGGMGGKSGSEEDAVEEQEARVHQGAVQCR